ETARQDEDGRCRDHGDDRHRIEGEIEGGGSEPEQGRYPLRGRPFRTAWRTGDRPARAETSCTRRPAAAWCPDRPTSRRDAACPEKPDKPLFPPSASRGSVPAARGAGGRCW